MASAQKVQSYLAYWFQLGKPVIFQQSQTQCLPSPIFQGSQLSAAFQHCWQKIMQNSADCFLRGTDESIADLLSDEWDIVDCARCVMPLPILVHGIKSSPCPCGDLDSWPNSEVPQPRAGVCSTQQLDDIRQRLGDRLPALLSQSPELSVLTGQLAQTIPIGPPDPLAHDE